MSVRIGYHNNVEYTLVSQSQGRVVIDEIRDYDEGNGNIYKRDKVGKGFLKTRKDAIQFYGSGYDVIQRQTATKGIAEEMALHKIEKDRTRLDEAWRSFPPDYLDLGTVEYEEKEGGKGIVKVKTTEGGIRKLIDSKFSDDLDLTALVDIEGNAIPSLERNEIFLEPKEIFLRSVMSVEDGVEIQASVGGSGFFGTRDNLNARTFLFEFDPNSDAENLVDVSIDELNAANNTYADLTDGKNGGCFLISSDTKKILTLNGKIKATIINANSGTCTLDLIRYGNGLDTNLKEIIPLDSCNPGVLGDFVEYVFNDYKIEVNEGEWLAFGLLSDTSDGIRYRVTETEIEITENSGQFSEASNSYCLTYKDALERLLYMLSGKEIEVVSDILTTGELSEDIILNGFWARQFPDIIQEGTDEERTIQFKVSLKKLLEHIEAIKPIAWWVEVKGDIEIFRLEELKYTQQNFIGIPFCKTTTDQSTGLVSKTYPQAYKITRKLTKGDFFSKIELGSSKGGEDYEEVYGLQSFCGRATFSTVNSNNDSTYSKISSFRLGDVDVELARRKPYSAFPDEDTQYDSDIMCIRAKKINGKFYLKKWQDIYEVAPTGVFGVNSAYNFEFSPAQLLINSHGFVVNSGLYHYPESNIVFAESNCNSSLITKKTGKDEIIENGVISVSRLENPRVRPQTMDCTLQVTQEIEDYINGYTDGVPNVFGLLAVNTGQTIEYFRMVQTDANKEGKHKFIEAFIR